MSDETQEAAVAGEKNPGRYRDMSRPHDSAVAAREAFEAYLVDKAARPKLGVGADRRGAQGFSNFEEWKRYRGFKLAFPTAWESHD